MVLSVSGLAERKRELIKGRGPVREIITLSEQYFLLRYPIDPIQALVERASDYYSVGGRFTRGFYKIRGAYYGWRAARDATNADHHGLESYTQIDVVSTILSKVPQIIGGDLDRAYEMVIWALSNDKKPGWKALDAHTTAFYYIRLGEMVLRMGNQLKGAKRHFDAAGIYQKEITDVMQLCRVASSRGAFYFDHFKEGSPEQNEGQQLLGYALGLAMSEGDRLKDQVEKIREMCRARGMMLYIHPETGG